MSHNSWKEKIASNSFSDVPSTFPVQSRSKIQGVIRYCQARPGFTRTAVSIFFNPMFAEACAYIGTPLLCNLSVVPAGSANTGLEQCIGQKSASEEASRNSGFKPNLDRSNLGHKNNLLVLLCAMGDGVLRCLVPFSTNLGRPSASVWKNALNGTKPMHLVKSPTRSWNGAWWIQKVTVPCFTLHLPTNCTLNVPMP